MAEALPARPDEYLDELHWVFSYHVGHLGVMAAEMDRLYLPQVAKDFRQSVATWDKLLSDIEEARGTAGARSVARGPAFSRSRPSPADAPEVLHLARQRREAGRGHKRSP